MSALSNYNPIELIHLPGVEIPNPHGLIVVVGPNSSGKTLFLDDIATSLRTGTGPFIVCKSIKLRPPQNLKALFDEFLELNYLRKAAHAGQYITYAPMQGSALTGVLAQPNLGQQQFSYADLEQAAKSVGNTPPGPQQQNLFTRIGSLLMASLSLEDRRRVCHKVPAFQYKTESPSLPIQALLINSDANEALAKETGNVFGNAVWLDSSEQGSLQLRISGASERPPPGRMTNPLQASRYRPIEKEGDGFKSYVGTCLSLLLGIRPVSLIDEPELCLHPPQAYHMGRFIGCCANRDAHVTFVATHSSHILRGILEASKAATIIRLTRQSDDFLSTYVPSDVLSAALRNPRIRAEPVLDGIFSKGVVLVESEGDRAEYQAAAESISDYPSREVHFVPVGGSGGMAEPCKFYRQLSIPVAAIADLDVVAETDQLAVVIKELCAGRMDEKEILPQLRDTAQAAKRIPPPITEEQVKAKLKTLSETSMDWKQNDDNKIRRELKALENAIQRVRKLKEGGVEAYNDQPEVKEKLQRLIEVCKAFGLFLVPKGELEDWVLQLMGDYPKKSSSKTVRALAAAQKIRDAPQKTGDIWDFVRSVLDFLKAKRGGP